MLSGSDLRPRSNPRRHVCGKSGVGAFCSPHPSGQRHQSAVLSQRVALVILEEAVKSVLAGKASDRGNLRSGYADGSIHSIYDQEFVKSFFIEDDRIYAIGPNGDRRSKLQTEESKALELVTDYPVKLRYPSFEAYRDEYCGFVKSADGRWRYTYNPDAKWDWWQIGGRFPNRFLVPAGLRDCIPSAKDDDGESNTPPEGYQYADAARKKDICWDLMRQLTDEAVERTFQKCVKAFESNDLTGFGPLCRICDDGIAAWGEMLYLKGETLDAYKARKGSAGMDRYRLHTYAFVDRNGDWISSGDMGWFGISSNDKDERVWNDEIQTLLNKAKDDDFLVIVDCHI